MPGSRTPQLLRRSHARALAALAALHASVVAAVVLAPSAAAEPTPPPSNSPSPRPSASKDECGLISGQARDLCNNGSEGGGSSTTNNPVDELTPLTVLARGCADAAAWTVDTLAKAVKSTATVDFTNPTFLSQYAVVFAASTVLTLIIWLLAVAKRAIRGVPLLTAVSEAVGFLWLTVLASAFTPLILYTLVSATDSISNVVAGGTKDQTDQFFGTFSEALEKGTGIGGGPIMLIVVSLVTIIAAGVLYLELFIRAVLLYVGALLGVVVYSGLVDKNMWGHVRRWAGLMIAIILVKPVILIVLGLAGALAGQDGPDSVSAVVSGLAIIILAIVASAMIYRFVPGFGDEIVASRNNRIQGAVEGRAAAVISSPAALVSQGIKTHSARGGAGGAQAEGGSSTPRPANPVGTGVAAHGSRPTGGGTGGGAPAAAPPPRSSPSGVAGSSTPHSNRKSTGGGGR
ncbi:hypothetical protein [Streptomyces sp. NPDC047315]|uniref:hypothetical protein n=1 Tax=Streptomyces sp. NPDC047315 TaxID=3155142 RepID=UPI0033D61C18